MNNSQADDKLSWRQWAEDIQKSKDDGFRELFRDRIRGSFLNGIKKQVFSKVGTEIFQYYDFRWSNENILTGKDDLPEYDVCRFIVGIHQGHSIFLLPEEIRKNERDARYREHLVDEVVEKMRLHRYGSLFFRKRALILGKEFLYYPVPYELFVLCVRTHELLVSRKNIGQDVCWPLYYDIITKGLAALSLVEDNFYGSAYPLCRGVLEMYFKLLVLNDNFDAAKQYKLFMGYEMEQSCCSQKYPKEFSDKFEKRRNQETNNKVAYMHFGWLDWVEGYHNIVNQTPYSMNGMIAYLKSSVYGKKRDELPKLEYFYKMCHGYTHGSVQGAIYPELHYFEISIMLYYAIRNTFAMLCYKHNEEPAINGVDVIAMVDRDIVELLGQYEERSTEKFELQQSRLQK